MRIGVENGFGKSGKQRIEDKASKNKPGRIAPGFVVSMLFAQLTHAIGLNDVCE